MELVCLSTHRQLPECDLTIPCLGLLTNLCRHNLPIQAHVKALVSRFDNNKIKVIQLLHHVFIIHYSLFICGSKNACVLENEKCIIM